MLRKWPSWILISGSSFQSLYDIGQFTQFLDENSHGLLNCWNCVKHWIKWIIHYSWKVTWKTVYLLFRGDCSHVILLAMHEVDQKDSASAFLISSVSLSGSDLMGVVSDSSNLGLSLCVKENKMYSLKK